LRQIRLEIKEHEWDIYKLKIESYELLLDSDGILIRGYNYLGYLRAIETLT